MLGRWTVGCSLRKQLTLPLWSCTALKTGRLMLVTVDSSEPATPASGDGTSSERPVLYTEAARPRPCMM